LWMETRTSKVVTLSFLDAQRRDLGHLAGELLILEGLDHNARRLAEVHLADVGLVDLAEHVHVAHVASVKSLVAWEPRTRMELTASPISTSRRAPMPSMGLTMVELRGLLGAVEGGLRLRGLRLGAGDVGAAHGDVAQRGHLLVERELVSLLGVFQQRLRNQPLLFEFLARSVLDFRNGRSGPSASTLLRSKVALAASSAACAACNAARLSRTCACKFPCPVRPGLAPASPSRCSGRRSA